MQRELETVVTTARYAAQNMSKGIISQRDGEVCGFGITFCYAKYEPAPQGKKIFIQIQ
jgi:hypothetical protein